MKHLPFDSKFRQNFQVVEQRQGRTSLYPHTDQLPHLLKALHTEFNRLLPPRLADADRRLQDYHKIALQQSALFFCNIINAARKDDVLLYPLFDRDLITRPAIVQKITEDHPLGRCHRFRFYAGEKFFPEIFANGKRIVFSDHLLQRFSDRTENYEGEDLSAFLIGFYGAPIIAMPVGPGRAFVVSHNGSILAFPYKETANEFFLTSCLTINEITSMMPEIPPHTITLHYDLPFVRPRIRNWIPVQEMQDYFQRWERKVKPTPIEPMKPGEKPFTWEEVAAYGRRMKREEGYGPGSQIYFTDYIPGPDVMQYKPTEGEFRYDEVVGYKLTLPDFDWETIIAARVAEGTFAPETWGGQGTSADPGQ